MHCPFCSSASTRVLDSRGGAAVRRRRECESCGNRFTTYERPEQARLTVIKSDGTREEFSRQKLLAGLSKSLVDRPVPRDTANVLAEEIEAQLRADGHAEVASRQIGDLVLDGLRRIDQVAYIRFSSHYQSFRDIEELKREVDTLFSERAES